MSDSCKNTDLNSESGNFTALLSVMGPMLKAHIEPMQKDVSDVCVKVDDLHVCLKGSTTPGAAPGLIARVEAVERPMKGVRTWMDRVVSSAVSYIVPAVLAVALATVLVNKQDKPETSPKALHGSPDTEDSGPSSSDQLSSPGARRPSEP